VGVPGHREGYRTGWNSYSKMEKAHFFDKLQEVSSGKGGVRKRKVLKVKGQPVESKKGLFRPQNPSRWGKKAMAMGYTPVLIEEVLHGVLAKLEGGRPRSRSGEVGPSLEKQRGSGTREKEWSQGLVV